MRKNYPLATLPAHPHLLLQGPLIFFFFVDDYLTMCTLLDVRAYFDSQSSILPTTKVDEKFTITLDPSRYLRSFSSALRTPFEQRFAVYAIRFTFKKRI